MLVVFYGYGQNSSVGISFEPLVSYVAKNDQAVSGKYRVGWAIGVDYDWPFAKNMKFSIGVGYSEWGIGFEKDVFWPSALTSTAIEKYRFKEFVFPIAVSLCSKDKDIKFFVSTGVTPAFVSTIQHQYNYFEPKVEDTWKSVKVEGGEYASFNLSVKLELGLQFNVSNRISGVIAPKIQTSIIPDSPRSIIGISVDDDFLRGYFGVRFGIRYQLKSRKVLRTLG